MSSEDEDMEDEYRPDTPEEVNKSDNSASTHVLPTSSKQKYNKAYDHFQKWNKLNGATPVSQNALMKYFMELAEKSKPPTLWANHSMLKATLRLNDNIDISSYSTLTDFLKRNSAGYKPDKCKHFTAEEIENFIYAAPDKRWLDLKVVCIFAVNGVNSSNKLVNVKVGNIKQYEDLILVTIPKTDTSPKNSFTITGTFYSIVQKYIDLRPENDRFFLKYHEGECKAQPIGRNKFYEMPRRIAKYLKLPKPESYTTSSFRVASANICTTTAVWNPPSVAEKQHIEYSRQIRPSLISYTSSSVSAASNKNDNVNDNKTGHVCTISCGLVKCATEEKVESVLHAFTIMKPSEYTVTEVTPAVFNSYPICRWIVAYAHVTKQVTSFNADEAFEDITRSIPNNVRVVQKYITRNSSKHLAAYIVEYGVNCKCQKQSSDMLNFAEIEMKCEI